MYNLKTIPIFASNYNLNIMLRVQEICKQQGITMQDLAKRMGVTYQALYAAVSGNPTIGKLGEIAKALGVGITGLAVLLGWQNLIEPVAHILQNLYILLYGSQRFRLGSDIL